MQELRILNSREKKKIYKFLEEQFGHTLKFDFLFLQNTKEKIYVLSPDFAHIDMTKLRVNNKALYFGKLEHDGFRPTIEGAQLLKANKNVVELTQEEADLWMQGEDIPRMGHQGFIILKFKEDILGCGMHKNDILRNMVPKERRLSSITI
jgi:NOL1/NOP2/fmu family ribosome biogenesis protein